MWAKAGNTNPGEEVLSQQFKRECCGVLIFGSIMVVGAVVALGYYIYRQATDPGYDELFANNYIIKHPYHK